MLKFLTRATSQDSPRYIILTLQKRCYEQCIIHIDINDQLNGNLIKKLFLDFKKNLTEWCILD